MANTTGARNIAIGLGAYDAADTENDNLAIGIDALGGAIAGGEYNVAIGNHSLDANTSGDENVAVGYNALTANTTASYNVAIGNLALSDANRTADANAYNTALGYKAGNTGSNDITTGDNNVLIGAMTTASAATASNQIVIGKGAAGHGDNIAVIGNTDMTAWHPADDNGVDLGSTSYEYKNLYVDGVAYLDAIGMGSTAMTLPTADGSAQAVLKTDGSGTLSWGDAGATSVNGLSDGLIEDNSMYIGHDPNSSTSTAEYNLAVGATALDAVTTGDKNVAI